MGKEVRPPRGFRDFEPELMLLRKKLFSLLEDVFQRYGFDPIDTPALEYWETLAGKYGEEAEARLIWRFRDPWSGREYALRYDLTVPLARFIATHRDVSLPFKRYHIAPVWRHEEPQRGRYREFYQCDADIVGSKYPEADAEIVNLLASALDSLGLKGMYRIRLNDRRLLYGIFEEELGIRDPLPVYRAIDKLDKIGMDGVVGELYKIGLGESMIERIAKIIELKGDPSQVLGGLLKRYGGNNNVREAARHLDELFELLENPGVVELDMSLVRGLDYYTGPIMEAVFEKEKVGSIAGGGRYDNLIGMFIGSEIPATGVSIGIERIIDAGIATGIYSLEKKTSTEVQVIVLDRESFKYAWKVANRLRGEGIKARIDLNRTNHRVQLRKARKLGIPIVVFIGRKERDEGKVTVYHVEQGTREEYRLEEAAPRIKERL
ncbi:MAG: histidine--tRNA ligase [Desulfurococcales archaeon]|nr:histidine--tRNA ligase [Desulfurococcales archaeon]